jgi:hypothetical protein
VSFNVNDGTFNSFYNRALGVRCTTEAMFTKLFTDSVFDALTSDRIKDCDFSGCIGNLTLSSTTSLIDVNMVNSAADVDTSSWTTYDLTLKGNIQKTFSTPDETTIGIGGATTVNVNRDGTTDLEARIQLASGQTELDMAAYKHCAGTIFLIPDASGNNIDSIINPISGREYKILSNEVSGNLSIQSTGNITINGATDLVVLGAILWSIPSATRNEVFFTYDGSLISITAKTNIYLY